MTTTLPTAAEMTRLYLYGSATIPNLADNARIRPDTTTGNVVWAPKVDVNEYMDSGPGRFVNAADFEVVRLFFKSGPLPPSPEGGYTKDDLFIMFGMTGKENIGRRAVIISQSDYSDGTNDLLERSYIWETTGFQIDLRARFFVGPQGELSIKNFGIIPYSQESTDHFTPKDTENFDFAGGSRISKFVGSLIKPMIDPSNIGRVVNIPFAGSRTVTPVFTAADFNYAQDHRAKPSSDHNFFAFRFGGNDFIQQLFDDGSIKFLDSKNRPILYGTNAGETINGTISVSGDDISNDYSGFISHPIAQYAHNGIAYIMGKGNDVVKAGATNDYLDGGQGNDVLMGGNGTDTYVFKTGDGKDTIIDSDGLGEIKLNGTQLTGLAAKYKGNGKWVDGGKTYKYDADKKTLTITTGKDSITIKDFDLKKAADPAQGYLGIHLKTSLELKGGVNRADNATFDGASLASDILHGAAGVVTLSGFIVSSTDQKCTISGGNANSCVCTGATLIPFDSSGNATITIPAGQDSVTLTLVDSSGNTSTDTFNLYASQAGVSGTVTSNNLAVTFDNTAATSQPPVHTPGIEYHGDYALATVPQGSPPPVEGATPEWNPYPYGSGLAWVDSNGNWVTDSGTPAPYRTDFIYGSAGDDVIYATQYESVSAGKNPSIAGPDLGVPNYVGGNSGNDTIIGGGIVTTGDGNNTIIYNSQDIPLTAKRIGVGNGNNTITITANGYKSDGSYVGNLDNGTGIGVTGGNGNNTITFGGLNAYNGVYLGNGDNQIYAGNQKIDLATALAQQKATPAAGGLSDGSLYYLDKNLVGTGASPVRQRGDVFAVVNGNNTIIGGANNTFFNTGAGNNEIVCGNGSNIVFTGADFHGWTNVSSLEDSGYAAAVTLGHQYHGMMAPDAVDGDSSFTDPYEGFFAASASSRGILINNRAIGGGNNTIFGGAGDSTYWLSNGNNWLDAGGGKDYIFSGAGNNTIYGGKGNDTIYGGGGNDYINLETGSDSVYLLGGNNTIIGGTGNNYIDASGKDAQGLYAAGDSYIYGGTGNTTILGGHGNDTLISGSMAASNGQAGTSMSIKAGDGNVYIVGGTGNDIIKGGAGSDTIYAGDGNANIQLSSKATETSTVYGGMGTDTIFGGAGTDVIYAGDGGTIDAPTLVFAGKGDSTLYGGAGIDFLKGGGGNSAIHGGSGDATLVAGSGSDTLYGGSGTDILQGGSGKTMFVAGTGNETIVGGNGGNTYLFNTACGDIQLQNISGADTFQFGSGISPADLTLMAGMGTDGQPALLIQTSSGQITISGAFDGTVSQFVFLDGGTLSLDQMMEQCNTQSATVVGAHGNLVFGASGNETLAGSSNGNDTIYSWRGGNTLVGGIGNETFVIHNSTDVIQAQSTGANTNTVKTSASYVLSANVQNITGIGSADISLTGNDLNNVITANSGNDTLIAGTGAATLVGGTGNDTFVVNSVSDVVQAQSTGANINTVISSVDYALSANVQNLTLTGNGDLVGTGNNYDNVIIANTGNDTLFGGGGNDTLIAGSGNDQIFAGSGNTTIQIDPATTGTDIIGGAGAAITTSGAVQLLNAYYQSQGINDWQLRYQYGAPNMFAANMPGVQSGPYDLAGLMNFFQAQGVSYPQAQLNGWVMPLDPLPTLAIIPDSPLQPSAYYANLNTQVTKLSASDYQGLAPLYASGVLPRHDVAFGAGVSAADLHFSWGQTVGSISGLATDPQTVHATLNISWGTNNQGVQVLIPTASDLLGSGVSAFTFADGSTLSMAQAIAMAPPAPASVTQMLDCQLGMGSQVVSTADFRGVSFGSGISVTGVECFRQGNDLLVKYGAQGDSVLLKDFALNGAAGNLAVAQFQFADGSQGSYVGDSQGNAHLGAFDANGRLVGDFWKKGSAYGNDTFNSDGSSSGTGYQVDGSYSSYANDGLGDVTTTNFSASGIKVGDSWVRADGTSGSDIFNSDGSYSSTVNDGYGSITTRNYDAGGTLLNYSVLDANGITTNYDNIGNVLGTVVSANDGLGNTATSSYDANGIKLSDTWAKADGTHGSDTFNTDGSSSGMAYNVDGSYSTNTGDGLGNTSTASYDSSGSLLGYTTVSITGGVTTTQNFDAGNQLLGYSTLVKSANDNGITTYFDPNGVKLSDTVVFLSGAVTSSNYDANGNTISDAWSAPDGSHGTDIYSSDGSSSGTCHNADSSYYTYTQDAQGYYFELDYNANGFKTGDNWFKADGSYGSDTFYYEGNSSGNSYNADGSYSTFTNDGMGSSTTYYFDALGNMQSETGVSSDGLGNSTTTYFDVNGIRLNDTWAKADGTHGADTFNANGSSSGTAYNADSSYSTYTNDGHGDITTNCYDASGTLQSYAVQVGDIYNSTVTNYDASGNVTGSIVSINDGMGNSRTTNYDASGVKLSDTWTNGGAHGTDVFNADGSSIATSYNPDGSYSTITDDGHSNVTTSYVDANGLKFREVWQNADGSHGEGYFYAGGSGYSTTYNADGSYSSIVNDGKGNVVTTNFDVNSVKLGDTWVKADGSHGGDTFNADGSSSGTASYADGGYSNYTNDGQGNATTNFYDANGNLQRYTVLVGDVLGNGTTTNYDASGTELGYAVSAIDSFGNITTTNFDSSGTKLSDTWAKGVTTGTDVFNADGSISGTAYNADNSYSSYINDGHGNVTTTSFDAAGAKLGYTVAVDDGLGNATTTNFDATDAKLSDTWQKADGTRGSDQFNADGSSTGMGYSSLESYNYINDGRGHVTTENFVGGKLQTITESVSDGHGNSIANTFDASGVTMGAKLSDSWTKADGTHGTDVFHADGSSSGTAYNLDGSYSNYFKDWVGDVTTANFNASGNKLSDTWAKVYGVHGTDIFNADGSSSGMSYNIGGNYSSYVNDGHGGVTITNFNGGGVKLSDSWTKADGTHGADVFNADGSGSSTAYNTDGSYSSTFSDAYGDITSNNYDVNGALISDSWRYSDGSHGSDVFNVDGSSSGSSYNADGSYSNYANDGLGAVTTTNFDANGNQLSDNWIKSDGSHGLDTFNPDGTSTGTAYAANGSYSTYTNDGLGHIVTSYYDAAGHLLNNGSGTVTTPILDGAGNVIGSSVAVNDGLGNVTTTSYDLNNVKLSDTWTKVDGTHGSDTFNADGSSTGTSYAANGSYSTYTNNGLGNVTTYNYDANNVELGYTASTSDGAGNITTTNYNAANGEVTGSVATAGAGYSYTYDNTVNVGGVAGVTESKVNYTYADGSTYATDTVYDPNGSYQQSTAKGDGSTTTTNYNAANGEVTGSVATAGAGYSYTYDNTVNIGGVAGVTESKVAYTYADGSTYATDTVYDPNGSYQQSTAKGDGSTTTTNYNAANGEVTGSVATAGAGYSYTYDNTVNIGGVAGVTESKVAYTYADGSTYATDTVYDPNGSYQQSTAKGDGSTTTTNYNAANGEVTGSVATAGAGYSYTYDNTVNVGGVAGVTESKVAYTYADGSTYATDTVYDPNGSYQQSTAKGDGSTTTTNYNAANGEVTGSVATAGAGYSYTYDNTVNVGGVAGVTESKVAYTYADGSTYATDTVYDPNGSYQQSTAKGDGSTTTTNYNAANGEVTGSVATAGAGYSYTYDNTVNVGGVAGATESKVNYTYADGSTYGTDTVYNPDHSYFQAWNKSDGTAGSSAVNASGILTGDSWVHADGSQGVDAGGNHLIMSGAGSDAITAATGNDILIGGAGNDVITTGAGSDIIAFNKGDGQDVVNAVAGQNNVLSLGGNFAYNDLALAKNGNDLILNVGASDSITFQGWYAGNQNIVDLQVIASSLSDFNPGSSDILRNTNVENFDFQNLVAQFDAAQAANPGITTWGVTNALLAAHLSGSDTAALGGDLAYQYGAQGSLSGMNVAAAETTLTSNQFATAQQSLNPWPTLNTGTAQIK